MENNYDPEIYDIMFSGSLEGDIEWYLQLAIRQGGPMLELGAGTGRTVLPIARAGIDICALEKDNGMLKKIRQKLLNISPEMQKRITIIQGDMRQFTISTRFQMIQIPFRTFLYNRTRKEQLSCLQCCYSHLKNGGGIGLEHVPPLSKLCEQ